MYEEGLNILGLSKGELEEFVNPGDKGDLEFYMKKVGMLDFENICAEKEFLTTMVESLI